MSLIASTPLGVSQKLPTIVQKLFEGKSTQINTLREINRDKEVTKNAHPESVDGINALECNPSQPLTSELAASVTANTPGSTTQNDSSAGCLQKNSAQQKSVSLSKKENGKVEPWWISGGVEECIAKAEEIADAKFDAAAYATRHKAWMATKIDCTAFLTYFIEGYPATVKEVRGADKSFWERFK